MNMNERLREKVKTKGLSSALKREKKRLKYSSISNRLDYEKANKEYEKKMKEKPQSNKELQEVIHEISERKSKLLTFKSEFLRDGNEMGALKCSQRYDELNRLHGFILGFISPSSDAGNQSIGE